MKKSTQQGTMIKNPTLEAQSDSVPIKLKIKKNPFPKPGLASSTARCHSEVQMTDQQDEMNCVPGFMVLLPEF